MENVVTNKKDTKLIEMKSLLLKAHKNMSDYKVKYKEAFEVKSENIKTDLTENLTVNKLKKLLSKYDLTNKVYVYNEDTLQEESIVLDVKNSKLETNKTNKSITVKELKELLDKFEWNDYVTIDDKYSISSDLSNPNQSNKSNKVILSLKMFKNE